ncbi:hypothetical protein TNCV_2560331 [Trichonephila clavipes]|uniref:Uncharacterized protein n=1 Tax=Trichonephila clavipes TaxID=2585209 RepID=A0A8X6R6E0_TRICX|nr:hypothetical protein TNCV_2560331 [Trichonephila clavipes]
MGSIGRNGPIAFFMCPIHAPSASLPYIRQKEHIVLMYFIRGVCYNTWTFTPTVPSAEHLCETHTHYVELPPPTKVWPCFVLGANNGFVLTNGVVSYAMDQDSPNELCISLHCLNVNTICVTNQHSKPKLKEFQASWSSSSQFKRTPVMLLNSNGCEPGQCPFCNQTICHRWIAVQGMCAILHQPINPIIHS